MDPNLRKQINVWIFQLRGGDKKAEQKLYERYYKRIQLYVYKNVWAPEIKDLENLVANIWLKLKDWFMQHYIEKSEQTVVYNQVRSLCRSVGQKDKHEPTYGREPLKTHFSDKEEKKDDEPLLPIHFEIFEKIFISKSGHVNVVEKEVTFKARFYYILSKCLSFLNDRQRNVINWFFYHGYNFVEIGRIIGTSNVTAGNECRKALENLRRCFNRHNIHSVEDLI